MLKRELNKKILALHFSKSADSYDSAAGLQREIAYQLVDWAYPQEGSGEEELEVLEIGCGTGFLTGFLMQRLKIQCYVALDLAQGMLARARMKLGETSPGMMFLRDSGFSFW